MVTCICSSTSAAGSVISATTRLPRVCSMLTTEVFLSVANWPSSRKCSSSRVVLLDPGAGRERRLAGHVLAGRVAGRVVEPRVEQLGDRELLDLEQLARRWWSPAPRRRSRSKCSSSQTANAFASRALVEAEDRRPLHPVVEHRRGDPAGVAAQLHAAAVRRDQRALGRRERDEELPLRVLAVDQQRPGQPDRHLRDAEEVLDVARQRRRVERVRRRRARAARRCCSRTSSCRALIGAGGVVVVAVARDLQLLEGRTCGGVSQPAGQPNGSGSGASETARARAAVSPRRWCWRQSTS